MREVVFVNVGQAGVQMSNAVWELFCIEHGIGPDGLSHKGDEASDAEAFRSVFNEVPNGQYVPRVVTVDLEPTVIDEVRTGCYRKLFHPDQLISGYEDAANNYARGHFTMGRKMIDQTINQIRKVTQACGFVQGYILVNSIGGGTGSGFSILLSERLSIEYTKIPKFNVSVYPSPVMESSVVSPYNTIMSTQASMEYIDLAITMDNEATYNICIDSLLIPRPTFNNINRLISQVLSSMTVSLRFENTINSDLDQLCTNLIPFPRIHFPTSHHAPMQNKSCIDHQISNEVEITRFLFTPLSQFVKVDTTLGKLMSCVMQYRGSVSPQNVNKALVEIKRRHDISFVEWCPTGFKIGINNFPPVVIPGSSLAQTNQSVTMFCNTTAIAQMWNKLNTKFDLLYSKRSFVHWFVGEGMEEGEFDESRDNLLAIIKDYEEVGLTDEEFRNGGTTPFQAKQYEEINIDMSKNIIPPRKMSTNERLSVGKANLESVPVKKASEELVNVDPVTPHVSQEHSKVDDVPSAAVEPKAEVKPEAIPEAVADVVVPAAENP